MKAAELYDTDFSEWVRVNVDLLRSGQVVDADLMHIAEEIEDMGKSEHRGLKSAVTQIMLHLLKYQMQPGRRSKSWLASIAKQRIRIEDILQQSPSLRPALPEILALCYWRAVKLASIETGIVSAEFPEVCPFTVEMLLDDEFPLK